MLDARLLLTSKVSKREKADAEKFVEQTSSILNQAKEFLLSGDIGNVKEKDISTAISELFVTASMVYGLVKDPKSKKEIADFAKKFEIEEEKGEKNE